MKSPIGASDHIELLAYSCFCSYYDRKKNPARAGDVPSEPLQEPFFCCGRMAKHLQKCQEVQYEVYQRPRWGTL